MSSAIRVLIVEDLEDDALLLARFLEGSGYDVTSKRVEDAESMRRALAEGTWDIVLSDYVMPGFSGLEALRILQDSGIDVPFIIVSGAIGEETAVEAMKAGAQDYIVKGALGRLVPAIERELEDALTRRERKTAEEKVIRQRDLALGLASSSSLEDTIRISARHVLEIPGIDVVAMLLLDEATGGFNLAYAEGATAEFVQSMSHYDASSERTRLVLEGKPFYLQYPEAPFAVSESQRKEGLSAVAGFPVLYEGRAFACLAVASRSLDKFSPLGKTLLESFAAEIGNSMGRLHASEALRQQLNFMQVLVEAIPNPVYFKGADGRFQGCNAAFEKLVGLPRAEIIGRTVQEILPASDTGSFQQKDRELLGNPGSQVFEAQSSPGLGEFREVIVSRATFNDVDGSVAGMVGVVSDITERKRAEEGLRAQRDFALELADSSSLYDVLLLSVERAREVAGMDAAGIYLVDDETGGFELAHMEGLSDRYAEWVRHFGASSLWGRLVMKGDPLFFYGGDERIASDPAIQTEGLLCLAVLPISHKEKVFACLSAGSYSAAEIPAASRSMLEALAAEVGGSIARVRASEALRQQLHFMQVLVDAIPNPVYFKDADGRYQGCNEAFERFMGLSREQIVGKTGQEIVPPERADMYQERDRELFDNPGVQIFEHRVPAADGVVRDLIFNKATFTDTDGNVNGLVGVIIDITERKLAEEALRESEGLYRSLIETSPDLISVLDMQGKLIAFSGNVADKLGITEQEIMGEHAVGFLAAGDREEAEKIFEELLRTGHVGNIEYDVPRKDGSRTLLDASATIIPDKDGNPRFVMAVAHDVTERRRAEEALRESEEKYRFLVETLNEGIWAIDLDGVTTFVNERMADMLGYSDRDMVGKPLFSFFPEEDPELAQLSFIRRRLGIEEEVVYELEKKDGSLIYASMHAAPIFDYRGNTIGSLAGVLDVTEKKRSEERQRFMVRLLELINRSGEETDTVSGMLHAIKEFVEIEAIGIRLKENDEYPYYQTEGFPEEFVAEATYIRARDERGQPLRGSGGEPVCECACGDVIEGRTDKDLPFFTDAGSFWTNSMADLLDSDIGGSLKDRRPDCVGFGYESVALIPLRFEGGVEGLLQFNDHRRDVFSEDKIRFLEQVGESVGIALDRKRAEELLKAERERYSQHFQDSTDVIFSIGAGPRMLSISPSIERLLGYKPEELIDKPFSELNFIAPESLERFVNDSLSVIAGESTSPSEYVFIAKDGTRKVSELKSTPLIKDGEIVGLVGVARDVTERKRLEEERRKLNEELERRVVVRTSQLEAANKELEAFSYSVSHDLQTPLRAIGGFTRMLDDEYSGVLDEEGRRLLSIICRNTDYMGELIDHLLTLSRVGRREVTDTEVDMNALVRQAVGELEPATLGRKVEFQIADLPPLHGDPLMWHQVWINLISNAVKFTGKKEKALIEVGVLPAESDNTYFIKDNGAGFDMKYADRLFGVFRRLHSPEDFEGVGVGLALVQRIVRHHGGRVWAEGEVGKGATFFFTGKGMNSD